MHAVAHPTISVLIPAYNGAFWLAETLDHIKRSSIPRQVIVVDNASVDKTMKIITGISDIHVLRNDKNLGFSHAINQAAAASRGKILVALNQDSYIQSDSLELIHAFLVSRSPAVIGGALTFPDATYQPSCGPFPTLAGTLWRKLLPRDRRKSYLFTPQGDEPAKVDWVTGAFLACTRETFERIGGFDEDYFMYYEDVDFCMRARKAGIPTYFLPAAKAVHVDPHSARKDVPVWLQREIRRSQMAYFRKHRPAWEYRAIRGLNRAYFAARGWPWPTPMGRIAGP